MMTTGTLIVIVAATIIDVAAVGVAIWDFLKRD